MTGFTALKKINDIDPRYIAEAELAADPMVDATHPPRRQNAFVRFFSSGVGVAILCGVVSFTVTFLIVMAGRNAGLPVVTPPDTEAVTGIEQGTEDTHAETELEVIPTLPESETMEEPQTETPTLPETQTEVDPVVTEPVTETVTQPVTEKVTQEPVTEPETEPYISVAGIAMEQRTYEMYVGESFHVEVSLYPQDATDQRISWSSSNTSVAEIDRDTGKLTALRQGATTITAVAVSTQDTATPIAITCEVTVYDRVTPATATQDLNYTWNGDYYTWKGMGTSTEKNVVLPQYVNGKPLKIIDLAYGALNGVGVESVTFSDTVESISTQAFCNSEALQEITFVSDIVVGQQAFLHCDSLTTVNGWEHITEMQVSAFAHCDALQSVTIYPTTTYGTTPFASAGIQNVTFATGVTQIPETMFRECFDLTEIHLPDTVTHIGSSAFAESGLTSIELPKGLVSLGAGAFSGANDLVRVEIPEGITVLNSNLFYTCDNLQEVVIPNSVTSIGGNAFSYCPRLTTIDLPDNLQSLGTGAFSSCTNLTKVEIPQTVTEIGGSCFAYCTSLAEVNLPEGLTRLEEYTFRACTSLTSIHLPESLTYIGDMALSQSGVENVYIPANVTHINTSAFAYNEHLKAVTFAQDAKLTHLYTNVFCECTSLESINLPDSLTYLGSHVFQDCSSLSWVYVGNSLTYLGTLAFDGCVSLDHIYLPETLSAMDWRSVVTPFKDCTLTVYTGMTSKPVCIPLTTLTGYSYEEYLAEVT